MTLEQLLAELHSLSLSVPPATPVVFVVASHGVETPVASLNVTSDEAGVRVAINA